jgi:hypothetical protein
MYKEKQKAPSIPVKPFNFSEKSLAKDTVKVHRQKHAFLGIFSSSGAYTPVMLPLF